MLANTLSLTVGTDPVITLLRNREDGGASRYKFADATKVVNLTIRNEERTNRITKTKFSVYNMSLVYETPDTPTVLGKTYTASFTGQYEEFGDPTFASNLNKALNVLGGTIMASLAGGEI